MFVCAAPPRKSTIALLVHFQASLSQFATVARCSLLTSIMVPVMTTLNLLLALQVIFGGINAQQNDTLQFQPMPFDNTYPITINQNYDTGSTVYDAHCIGNTSDSRDIVYGLHSSHDYFIINSTSGVVTMNVSARDLPGRGPFTAILHCRYAGALGAVTVQLSVQYRLENEHVPRFTHEGQVVDVWIREDHVQNMGPVVIQLNVTDGDLSPCDIVTFQITSGNEGDTFRIDSQTGILELNAELDYETNAKYNLSITATNTQCGDRLYSAQTFVCVYVEDVNDEHPTFTQHVYNFSLSEKQQPTHFAQIQCIDADSAGVQILYDEGYVDGEYPFEIDYQSGHLSATQTLDYEQQTRYHLTFQCFFLLDSYVRDTAVVIINVIPLNEFLPEVSVSPSFFQFSYATPVGMVLASARNNSTAPIRITATDRDRGLDHGRILFTLAADNNDFHSYFRIDTDTGDLALIRSLDFDVCSSNRPPVVLRIIACDGPHRNSTDDCPMATITLLIVVPQNACTLTFLERNYTANISESSPIGSELLHVHCRVPGKGISQRSNIEVISLNSTFSRTLMVAENGTVTLQEPLDYELVQHFSVLLRCTNDDPQETNTTLTVNILPENDNSPYFQKSLYYFKVPLDHSTTSTDDLPLTIGNITAMDNDKGILSNLTYGLTINKDFDTTYDITQYFSINKPTQSRLAIIVMTKVPRDDVSVLDISVSDGIASNRSSIIVYLESQSTSPTSTVAQATEKCGTTCLVLIVILIMFMLATALVIVVVCTRFLYVSKRKQQQERAARMMDDHNNFMLEQRDCKSDMRGYSTIQANNLPGQEWASSPPYAGSMVAACPVYAQTDKAFGKTETEDSEYVSADYHYISHRGVKLPRRTSSAKRAQRQKTASVADPEMDDYIKMELSLEPQPESGGTHTTSSKQEACLKVESDELGLPLSLGKAGSFRSLDGETLTAGLAVENIYERIQ